MEHIVQVYKDNEIQENLISGRTKGKSYYTVLDKGVIYGSTVEIVKRKIYKLNAKPKYKTFKEEK